MVRMMPGLAPAAFEDALTALTSAKSIEEINALIDQKPVIAHEAFLAKFVRQCQSGDPAISACYEALILVLHLRAHKRWCTEPAERRTSAGSTPPEPYASVLQMIRTRTLTPLDQPFDPASGLGDLSAYLETELGGHISLPLPTPSSMRWNLGLVRCPSCGTERALCRPHAMDLAEVESALRAGAFEDQACPHCGDPRAKPQWLLMCDRPWVRDALAALCTVIRVSDEVYLFRPPTGTVDNAETRLLLERRMSLLPKDFRQTANATGTSTHLLAYSHQGLVSILDEMAKPPDPHPLPMRVLIEKTAERLRRREIGYEEAEEFVIRASEDAANWPLVLADVITGFGSEEDLLVTALIAERVARLQDAPLETRVITTLVTAIVYQMLNEFGAAERVVARAEDLLHESETEDQNLRDLVEHHKAEIRIESGSPEDARPAPQLDFTGLTELSEDQKVLADLAVLEPELREGADALRESRLTDALRLLPGIIENLDKRLAGMPSDHPARRAYEHRRCGALGNLGGTLRKAANVLADEHTQSADALRTALSVLFPEGFTPDSVRKNAIDLLEEGTQTAAGLQEWGFAATQGLMLTEALEDAERDATASAKMAAEWAAQAGDHAKEGLLRLRVGTYALVRKDLETALEALSSAAIASIRQAVVSGHRQRFPELGQVIAYSLLTAARAGADAEQTALILESLKAATTAKTLSVGFPVGPAPVNLLSQRERLRLKLLRGPGDSRILESLAAIEEELGQAWADARLRDPRFLRWVDSATLALSAPETLRRRLGALGTNTRYFGFFQSGGETAAYLLGGDKPSLVVRPTRGLHGIDLATWLVKPFSKALKQLSPDDRLIISPDPTMPGLPFAAARVAMRVLAERATLSFVQGVAILEALSGRPRPTYIRATAVGAPTRPGLRELPAARREAATVCAAFPGGKLLLGPSATVAALRDAVQESDILHFACHAAARVLPDHHNSLFLAPDVAAEDSGDLSDDRIITELTLRPGSFVNLAGCETAHQEAGSGPLLVGLVPAFLVAGAGSVLATIMRLPDKPSLDFQQAFYQQLKDVGSPVAALTRCQRLARKGQLGKNIEDPAVWANFILYGYW